MSDNDEKRQKKKYAPGNTGADGDYIVGKGKPPQHGKFKKGDERKRGRRRKGTQNLATDFREEMRDSVTVSVGGKTRRVSKQRSLVMRLLDNASRGQVGSLKLALEYGDRFGSAQEMSGELPADATAQLPNLDDLSRTEMETLGKLLGKAAGVPYNPPPSHPLNYINNPDDNRNYYSTLTLDGLHYTVCTIAHVEDKLTKIDNRAYWSAALPRKPGYNQRQV
ncbi:DUF5681 domain-containing protein [Sphingomonas sp. LT1P40]|uniref:DUF5681 domain-containing protein n=1 Tax=Alteristakelama amylovorans TaxID=3096166 RepID=UPI002FC648D4